MLAGCQKENTDRLMLVAEGMGGDQKMYVDGLRSYWVEGDQVNINGTPYTINVNNSSASISGDFNSGETYYGVFPASIYFSREGNDLSVSMPRTYHYNVDGSGHQIVDAPMAAYGNPQNGKLEFKHLTGALAIKITAPQNFCVDSIIVMSTGGEGYYIVPLNGIFHIDINNIGNYDGQHTRTFTQESEISHLEMVFDKTELEWTSSGTKTVQIPIPVTVQNANTKFKIRVAGHIHGTKRVYERTQSTAGRVLRAKLGYADVDMSSYSYTTSGPLFSTDHEGYYKISSPIDFRLMCKACPYGSPWSYDNNYYNKSNYRLYHDIDMSGVEVSTICYMGTTDNVSIIDGNNHTVSNLYVKTANVWANHTGFLLKPENVTLKNITINNLTISGMGGQTIDSYALCDDIQSGSVVNIDNVTITDYKIQFSGRPYALIGGFVGQTAADVTISNSRISFADNYEYAKSGDISIGGIARYVGGTCTLTVDNVLVNYNHITFRKTEHSANFFFGGAIGSKGANASFNPTHVSLIGTVYLQWQNHTDNITASPVIGGGITSHQEVDATGLRIYKNGVLQGNQENQ